MLARAKPVGIYDKNSVDANYKMLSRPKYYHVKKDGTILRPDSIDLRQKIEMLGREAVATLAKKSNCQTGPEQKFGKMRKTRKFEQRLLRET